MIVLLEMEEPAKPARETEASARGRREAARARRAITVYLPMELLEEVHAQRLAEGRSLTEFVRRSLASAVDLGRKYSPLRAGQGRGR